MGVDTCTEDSNVAPCKKNGAGYSYNLTLQVAEIWLELLPDLTWYIIAWNRKGTLMSRLDLI